MDYYLVHSKEAKLLHNTESTDLCPTGNFTCYLETNLHNLQWICEYNL